MCKRLYEACRYLDKEYWDTVKCTWCNFEGLVPPGEEHCPKCKKKGNLAWADENAQ